MKLENTPILLTKRLILRKFTMQDTKAMFEILSDATTNTFLPWLIHTSINQTKKFLHEQFVDGYSQPNGYKYAICLQKDNIPIGYVWLSDTESRDFGYCVKRSFWHKGIGFEAAQAVVNRIKSAGYDYITATHDISNPNSGAILQKLGMTYKYSYVEQWQPKDIAVTFRMYQLNFDEDDTRTYTAYWDKYENHFIEGCTITLIAGTSHTGKTLLAQKLLEKYGCPYLSIDHLKMGLIRSGYTTLTPEDDQLLTQYLWPILREIIKTNIENKQSLIIEGCYIPLNWQEDFTDDYLAHIKYKCLVMSENYVHKHFDIIKEKASEIERRLDNSQLSAQELAKDNAYNKAQCEKYNLPYILIDETYDIKNMVQQIRLC